MEYVKVEGLDGLLKRLQAFPKEMAKNGGPIRAALAKAGKPIREDAKANVRAIIAEENASGRPTESTGLLEKSIILKRHKDPRSRGATELYQVKVKRGKNKKHKSKREPEGVSVTKYGKALEFGTEKVKAYSWLRRAAEANRNKFGPIVAKELAAGIKRIERKLGALK